MRPLDPRHPLSRLRYHVSGAIERGDGIAITEQPVTVVPTEHAKREWSRMAQAAYGSDHNDIGHRFSMASATTPVGGRMELKRYDSIMAEYRAWLVFGEWPSL